MVKKFLFIVLSVFIFSGSFWAQEFNEHEELDIDELETQQEGKSEQIDKQLQSNFVILESSHPHDLNPHTTSYSADSQVLVGLYEGLFSYNPVTLEPQYALATEYHLSRDKKRVIFKLRQNARFSNGETITAESVRMSWLQLLMTPDAPYSSMLDIIRGASDFRTGKGSIEDVGIYVTGEYQLSVYLNQPANYLPKILCQPAFAVIHQNPTVYSGPFYMENQVPGMLQLKKNPFYWDLENTYLEHITFVQSDDGEENAFLFNSGVADWIASDAKTEKILNKNSIQLTAEFGVAYYFFKTSAAKPKKTEEFNPWDYREFRTAVLEAVPWNDLRGVALVPAATFVYPLAGYPVVDGYTYTDQIEASILMADAKKKYGIDSEKRFKLVFDISEGGISDEKAEIFVKAMDGIGVDLVINRIPSALYFSSVKCSNADLFAYTWIGDFADPLAFLDLFKGDSTLNDSGWKNAQFDDLLFRAASVSDEERMKLLGEAENLLLDEGMVLPIYHPVSFNVINLNEVGGWANNAFDIHPLKYLYKKHYVVKMPNVVKK